MQNKLKPCPFCGSEINVELEAYPEWHYNSKITYGCYLVHECDNASLHLYVKGCETAEKAVETLVSRWNSRKGGE